MRRRRRAREKIKRKQATDFKEAVSCPSAVVKGAAQRKNEAEYLGPSGRPTAILTQPKRGRVPHHHVEAAVDWCSVWFVGLVAALKIMSEIWYCMVHSG